MSLYTRVITEQLSKLSVPDWAEPRHVEAYMRCKYSTLDHLDRKTFNREVKLAARGLHDLGQEQADALALSYGLGPEESIMTIESETEELARLRAENAALKAAKMKEMSFKVSEKGAVSVYGLQRFPVTLYKEQWLRILDEGGRLRAFIADNEASLAKKES